MSSPEPAAAAAGTHARRPVDGDALRNRDVWDGVFSANAWGRWPSEAVVRVVSRLAQQRGAPLRALEIGCGPGAQLWYLTREGHTAVGLDVSGVALHQAAARLRREGGPCSLVNASGAALPFAVHSFDVVLDVEAFAYSPATVVAAMWAECARVLRPGGCLVSQGFADTTDVALGDYLRHPHYVSPDAVERHASGAGMTIVDQQRLSRTHGPDHRVIEEILSVAVSTVSADTSAT